MKHEEYKTKIDAILQNTDTGLADIGGVYDELEKDLTARDTAIAKVEELENTVKELRETNMKLYLSQNGTAEAETLETLEEKEEKELEKEVDTFFDDILK